MTSINWGILGTGYVAKQFAQGLQQLPYAKLLAVGSRQLETAQKFAQAFQVPRSYHSYEALVQDQEIDIIYIATPNSEHYEHCLLSLQAGKAVLCEKPFTLNAQQAREVIAVARTQQLFCMEALWTRFLPLMQQLPLLLKADVIGEVKLLIADFGLRLKFNPQDRRFNPALGGGALLDLGIYPIALASYLWGRPTTIHSHSLIGNSQVDEQTTMMLGHAQGTQALLACSFLTTSPQEALLLGTHGRLKIHAPLYRPAKLSIQSFSEIDPTLTEGHRGGIVSRLKQWRVVRSVYNNLVSWRPQPTSKTFAYQGNGYHYEAAEAMRCLQQGLLESQIMPLAESLSILETLDTIRAQANFKYPIEITEPL